MDVSSVTPSVISSISGQQAGDASKRVDQNDQAAKDRAALAEKADKAAAAKAAQAANEQASAPVAAPKPVVNSNGQTIGKHINITA